MDYSRVLKDLEGATTFDLYRLVSALRDEMKSAQRIKKVRSGLKVSKLPMARAGEFHILY